MVAPLIIAAARTLGPQLARGGAARAAGAQIAKGGATRTAGTQLAKNAPRVAGKPTPNTLTAPAQTKGPVYGYNEPKVAQSDIDVIKDWQGNLGDNNKEKSENTASKAGERLSPQNISGIKRSTTETPSEDASDEAAQDIQSARGSISRNMATTANLNQERPIAPKKPSIYGSSFWLVLIVVVLKDFIDLIFAMLSLFLEVLVLTAPVGMLLEVIDWILDLIVFVVIQVFYKMNGVPFSSKKIGLQVSTLSLEAIPFAGALPANSASFIYQTMQINKEREAENVAAQKQLDEQFEQQQMQYRQQMEVEYEAQMNAVNQMEIEIQNRANEEPVEKTTKATGKEWQEMVDQSDQNITKSNNQKTVNTEQK